MGIDTGSFESRTGQIRKTLGATLTETNMSKDFSEVMSERTDKQLVDIITIKRQDYQADAVVAAELEFKRRNLNLEDFNVTEVQNIDNNKAQIDDQKFEWYHKLLTFIMPALITRVFVYIADNNEGLYLFRGLALPFIVLVQYIAYKSMKKSGNVKFAAQFLKWVTYSYYIYIGLAILIFIIVWFLLGH